MSKIMSVGGYNPSKIAVGVSLDANGKVQVNNPKVDKIIGTIVEPHDDSYRGLVAVLGANCIAKVDVAMNPDCKPFKDGNTYILGAGNIIYILDQNLNIIKSIEGNSTGGINGCYADSDYVYTYKGIGHPRIEKYKKPDLSFVKVVEDSTPNNYGSVSVRGLATIVGDEDHLYSIIKGKIVKYDKELNLVASKDLTEPPVSDLTGRQYRILGVHNKKLIFSMWISNDLSRLFSVDLATLDVIEIGSGVGAISSFIDGDKIVSVSANYMEITNISTGDKTSHPIGGNFSTVPANIFGISNGKYAVVSGTYPATDVLEVREVSSKDGYESRVYRINLDFGMTNTYIDEIGRVWVIGNSSIMLLNDELSLKGYRIV